MELKNIFKMTKADRYTQDGRDELAKLQETEDVTYKTGDISQKTGLQKQPDGSWAPPKNAGKNVHGAEIDKIYEKHQKRIKELKAKGYTDEQIENDKIYQQTKEDMRNVGKSKPELTQTDWVKQKMEQYKDLSPEQKKDAMYAASYEGITIGGTQNGMERAGWELVSTGEETGENVNVYAKPDGSKVTMKHDGKTITSSEYEAPGSKPAGNNLEWNEMPNGRVWTSRTPGGKNLTVTWNREKNGDVWYGRSDSETKYKSKEEAMNAPIGPEKKRLTWSPNASVSEKLNDIIKLGEGSEDRTTGPGKYISPKVQENYVRKALSKRLGATEESIEDLIDSMDEKAIKNAFNGFMENYSSDSAPRELTGDCKIRIRK